MRINLKENQEMKSNKTRHARRVYTICLVLFSFCLLAAAASIVVAHEGLYEQLAQVTLQIRKEPRNPDLYLKRGELYRLLRQWDNALADYDRALQLNPGWAEADFYRGRMWLEAKQPGQARQALDRFLRSKPQNAGAWLLRGRAHEQMNRHGEAAIDFGRALELTPRPKPDVYLERAKAQIAAGHLDEALRGLDDGIAKLGPLVTLHLQAIEIETKLKRWDAALARLERVSTQSPRKEGWLARRGNILLEAGRKAEAHEAFGEALRAIEALPPRLRQTRAMQDLEKQIRSQRG